MLDFPQAAFCVHIWGKGQGESHKGRAKVGLPTFASYGAATAPLPPRSSRAGVAEPASREKGAETPAACLDTEMLAEFTH